MEGPAALPEEVGNIAENGRITQAAPQSEISRPTKSALRR